MMPVLSFFRMNSNLKNSINEYMKLIGSKYDFGIDMSDIQIKT